MEKRNATTTQEKNTACKIVTQQFNARNESGITAKQLKELYGLLKRKARKNLHNDRAERIKTGGGAYSTQSSEMDHKIVCELKPQFVPDENPLLYITTYQTLHFENDPSYSGTDEPALVEEIIEVERDLEVLASTSEAAISTQETTSRPTSAYTISLHSSESTGTQAH
ncbi:hypothetical protein ILUMI_05730 [Ignelater luminosus]|uniref:Regulatory protein zeste n=1 Tax=Ignelater luminosus TaxID=2038154 RepID=A0A8K0D9X8_IGNLU|nr:hypothetical protein ILUMI_05730 [Ignelater luminosus]